MNSEFLFKAFNLAVNCALISVLKRMREQIRFKKVERDGVVDIRRSHACRLLDKLMDNRKDLSCLFGAECRA